MFFANVPSSAVYWKASYIDNHVYSSKLGRMLTAIRRLFTCTVKLSYSYSLIRLLNWTCPCPSIQSQYAEGGTIDLLSNSATVSGDMPRSAGGYWTFLRLAKQAINKLTSGIHVERSKHGQLYSPVHFSITYALLLVKVQCLCPSCLQDSCFLPGFLQQIYAV